MRFGFHSVAINRPVNAHEGGLSSFSHKPSRNAMTSFFDMAWSSSSLALDETLAPISAPNQNVA
jgi:hypothetical protein